MPQEVDNPLDVEYLAHALDAKVGIWIDDPNHILHLRITRKDPTLLELFRPLFPALKQNSQGNWFVEARSKNASTLLEQFLPYFRLAKPFAILGIEYQEWKNDRKPGKLSKDDLQKCQGFLERMKNLRHSHYDYDIGEEPLLPKYLTALIDQGFGSVNILGKSPVIQINPGNKSFIEHLQTEYGGSTYPQDSDTPEIWRVTGKYAENFLRQIDRFPS